MRLSCVHPRRQGRKTFGVDATFLTGRAIACGVNGKEIHTGIEARLGSLPLAMQFTLGPRNARTRGHREAGNDEVDGALAASMCHR